MRALAALALAGALAAPAPAAALPALDAAGPTVSIAFAAFEPAQLNVLVGDTVSWHNDSLRAHDVSADDDSFDSARLEPNATFAHRFDTTGPATYYCRLHTFMHGEIDVHRILIDAPTEPGAPGRAYALVGRAALPGGTEVSIEGDSGAGFGPAGTATVGADGVLHASVIPRATTVYRAVAGDQSSPPVQLLVLDRKVTASVVTRRRRATVNALVTPASPGSTVVLQLRLRRHFGWWPVARATVGRDGRARLAAPVGARVPARVVLTLSDAATPLATSATLHVGSGR